MIRTLRDLRWWWRAGRVARLDGMRVHGGPGVVLQAVRPDWWRLDRWWVWLARSVAFTEMTLTDKGGGWAFLRVRLAPVPKLKKAPIVVRGRSIVEYEPRLPTLDEQDPRGRNVPDALLEKYGMTWRSRDEH